MYIKLLCLLISLCWTISARAGDHLEPEPSIYAGFGNDEYDSIVQTVLGNAFQRPVRARMISIPSFDHEYSVFIEGVDDFKVVHERSSVHLWRYELAEMWRQGRMSGRTAEGEEIRANKKIDSLLEGMPKDFHEVEVERCEVAISADFAESILSVWDEALLQTRYSDERTYGTDGTTYHFSTWLMGGQTWSPDKDSLMRQLVQLTDDLRNYCHDQDLSLREKMRKDVMRLSLLLRLSRLN